MIDSYKKVKLIVHYIIKRILFFVPVLLVVSALIFFLIRLTPSDPMSSITGGRRISEETRSYLRAQYHLDQSLPKQYLIWLGDVF
jgi:peptide/nickel transport system permease protein